MVNPFDRTFFKFVLGFMFILTLSFAVLFFVNKNSTTISEKQANAVRNSTIINK